MKKTSVIFLAVFIIFSLYAVGHAYRGEGTNHVDITNVAVDYLGLTHPPCIDVQSLKANLEEGSRQEDNPGKRTFFHFLPNIDSALIEPPDLDPPIPVRASCSAIDWGFEAGATCNGSVDVGIFVPYSFNQTNTHTWSDAIKNANTAQGWKDLGYVLHLLEDLSVPAHVRNDPHFSFSLSVVRIDFDPEPYELASDGNRNIETPSGDLKRFTDPKEFFEDLGRFTRSNYFSSDTCFHPDLPGPPSKPDNPTDDYFYHGGSNQVNRKIAYKGSFYRLCEDGEVEDEYFIADVRRCATINPEIAKEQFAELAPIAAQYVASLIRHYYDTVARVQITAGPHHKQWPAVNTRGDIVWSEDDGTGHYQVKMKRAGSTIVESITQTTAQYSSFEYPSIDDYGNVLCAAWSTQTTQYWLLKYHAPGDTNPEVVEYSSKDIYSIARRDAGAISYLASNGTAIWYYDFTNSSGSTVRRLNVSGVGRLSGDYRLYDMPAINSNLDILLTDSSGNLTKGTVNQPIGSTTISQDVIMGRINDTENIIAITNNGSVNNGSDVKVFFAPDYTKTCIVDTGSWASINNNGIIVFDNPDENGVQQIYMTTVTKP